MLLFSGFAPWEHADFDSLIQRDKEDWLTEENVEALVAQVPGLKEKLGMYMYTVLNRL